ncbi:MAG: outer membrane protein assembly factor BamD [Betaproteobacteria bacterium]|nr:outer membrane protein assembly factor BamD [Betaproteobacteria bacterium]
MRLMSIKAMAASAASAAFFLCVGLSLFSVARPAAAIFSDDEARRAIIDLRARLEALESRLTERIAELERNLQASARTQLQLLNENERLRSEVARLRGSVEEANQNLNTGKSQQKDLYGDLDQRLKQIEPVLITIDKNSIEVSRGEKTRFDEVRDALKAGDFPKTVTAADAFQQAYPYSRLSADVLLLKGSALYADKNYKAAIAARQEFLDRYSTHPARPQVTLNLAAAQAESGNPNAARGILEGLIKAYPNSPAAADAKERLKLLRPGAAAKPAPKAAPAK